MIIPSDLNPVAVRGRVWHSIEGIYIHDGFELAAAYYTRPKPRFSSGRGVGRSLISERRAARIFDAFLFLD